MGRTMGQVFSSCGLFYPWDPSSRGSDPGRVPPSSNGICQVCLYGSIGLDGEFHRAGLFRGRRMDSAVPSPTSDSDHCHTLGSLYVCHRTCGVSDAESTEVGPRPCMAIDLHALFRKNSLTRLPRVRMTGRAFCCAAVQLLQPVTDLTLSNRPIHLSPAQPLFECP
jgi:hypothetical protein